MYVKVMGYLIALLLAALVICGTGWYVTSRVAALKADTIEDAGAEANTRAAEVYGREAVRVYRDKEKAREQVRVVNERHPEWSDQPLPDDVADILRKPTEAK